MPDGRKLADLETDLSVVFAVSFARDGNRIACAGEGGAELVEMENGSRHRLGAMGVTAHGVDIAANGLAVAVASDDGFVRLFDPELGTLLNSLAPIKKDTVARAVRVDASCTRLAAAYADGTVRLWNIVLARGSAVITPGADIAGRSGDDWIWGGLQPEWKTAGQRIERSDDDAVEHGPMGMP